MNLRIVKTSAPGSMMITGEHAVLRGYPALVGAINLRMRVEIQAQNEQCVTVESDKFGLLNIPLANLDLSRVSPPFHFIANTLAPFASQLTEGLKIKIHSEFSPTLGLGSSAALTVALLYALLIWFKMPIDKKNLALQARDIIRLSQNGLGSGADVMASVFGGVVYYQMSPFLIECLETLPPLVTVYSGSKTPTPVVIDLVNKKEADNPALMNDLFDKMGHCSLQACQAIKQQDWQALGKIFSAHAALQEALGVSTPALNKIQHELNEHSSLYGAKISGSGLGDCIIAVGTLPSPSLINVVEVNLSPQGVSAE